MTTTAVKTGDSWTGFDSTTALDGAAPEVVDAARLLLASLHQHAEGGVMPRRLGFTSALAGEGVTYLTRIVAALLAHDSRERVCILDLNWGGPGATDGRRSRRKNDRARQADRHQSPPGLAEVLRRELSLRDAVLPTGDPRLTVIAAGTATEAEGQVFARSDELAQIIRAVEQVNDRLVLDLPPVLSSTAALALARHADSISLVVRAGVTTESQVRTAIERLGHLPFSGVVLNRASTKIPKSLQRRLANW